MALEELLTPPPGSRPSFVQGEEVVFAEEFAALVEQYAAVLRERALRPGDRVAIVARKSVRTLALIYAALREGVVFVPVDPLSPPRRLAAILTDCAPSLVALDDSAPETLRALTDTDRLLVLATAPPPAPADPRRLFPERHPPNATAYLIYTSGSTGEPKGVGVPRSALEGFLRSACERAGYDADTVFLSFFPLHFDPVLMEIFAPWSVGGRSVLFGSLQMINDLLVELSRHEITDFSCTPNVVSMLVGRFSALSGTPLPALRSIWMGGEQPNAADLRVFQRSVPGVRLFNGYGPTECTVACSLHELPDLDGVAQDHRVPIGTPFPGVRFVIVDDEDRPIEADDARGHLLIGGVQLMSGYWGGRGGSDDEVFAQLPDGPYYRTGDLVERSAGQYVFAGRSSRMIKLSGLRIHPAEVESALLTMVGVSAAVVLLDERDRRLVALVEAAGPIAPADCVRHLDQRVPAYMIPARIEVVAALPRLSNGKIDHGAVREQVPVRP